MAEAITRWSQWVRDGGPVEVQGHHGVQVPALGLPIGSEPSQPGIRLLTKPLGDPGGPYAVEVTSTAAIAMLEGFLQSGVHVGKRIHASAKGRGKLRRDTIQITPIVRGRCRSGCS